MFSLQSAPPFLFASGDAGEGCQQDWIVVCSPESAFLALDSAYFPTPITVFAPNKVATSLRCLSQVANSSSKALPAKLFGVILVPRGPEKIIRGQWFRTKTLRNISSEEPYLWDRTPQSLVPETSSLGCLSPFIGLLGCILLGISTSISDIPSRFLTTLVAANGIPI